MNGSADKNRVLMVIKKFHQDYAGGGTERSGYRLARALVSRGTAVDIIGARMERHWKRSEAIGESDAPVSVRRLPHPGVRFFGTLIYNIILFFRILLERKKYCCVHIHFASFEMMTAVIARCLGGPPVICKIACSGESGELVKARRRYFAPIFFSLFRRIDAAAALSEEIRGELIDAGIDEGKIRVIPNGIDPSTFHPLPESEKRKKREELGLQGYRHLLIFTGRLTRQKGLDILLKSLRMIAERDFMLLIAGRGELEAELRENASNLGLEQKVRFLGPVKDVLSLYQAGDIFVLPSRQEGLSNSLLEAMSSGMKVVATGISGSSRVIENGISGLLVRPEEPEELAGALTRGMDMDQKMGIRARERIISGYSVDKVAGRYQALYSDISNH
ncbi:MAG: glycosyltransferase [Candidatus Latescibacteria bacterium]|nr:glycosyltransferase [bacterium]MBD3423853.1 glycosyltransferase [Candidatus Latescibacterota bacterium]